MRATRDPSRRGHRLVLWPAAAGSPSSPHRGWHGVRARRRAGRPVAQRTVMHHHDAKHSPAEHLSRHSVLAGAATAGAASLAAAALVGLSPRIAHRVHGVRANRNVTKILSLLTHLAARRSRNTLVRGDWRPMRAVGGRSLLARRLTSTGPAALSTRFRRRGHETGTRGPSNITLSIPLLDTQ